jgi:hypothetical protein
VRCAVYQTPPSAAGATSWGCEPAGTGKVSRTNARSPNDAAGEAPLADATGDAEGWPEGVVAGLGDEVAEHAATAMATSRTPERAPKLADRMSETSADARGPFSRGLCIGAIASAPK